MLEHPPLRVNTQPVTANTEHFLPFIPLPLPPAHLQLQLWSTRSSVNIPRSPFSFYLNSVIATPAALVIQSIVYMCHSGYKTFISAWSKSELLIVALRASYRWFNKSFWFLPLLASLSYLYSFVPSPNLFYQTQITKSHVFVRVDSTNAIDSIPSFSPLPGNYIPPLALPRVITIHWLRNQLAILNYGCW